jgi:hypothetical protein
MAFYCQNMLEIALILSDTDPMYEEIANRFLEHFLWITYAMDRIGVNHDEMWDTTDGFFYDLLHFPGGEAVRLKVRSMVGLLPLCASTVFEHGIAVRHPRLFELLQLFHRRHPEVVEKISPADERTSGYADRRLLAVCNKKKLSTSWPGARRGGGRLHEGVVFDTILSICSSSVLEAPHARSLEFPGSPTNQDPAAIPEFG